ncbi:hypothetical protein Enr13x_43590 [Stieleria neptunia]|uniref:Uncharacterized protein n=1 Tax=Stieleria neptunia TaxID=2527979 RepID=A0A518HUM0_9BACT|nr:hypothetical protein Enr13x_43590 [Stieleria neptunia]
MLTGSVLPACDDDDIAESIRMPNVKEVSDHKESHLYVQCDCTTGIQTIGWPPSAWIARFAQSPYRFYYNTTR